MTDTPHTSVVRITAPAVEPVSLNDTKLFLRVEHALEDSLISGLIMAAREAAEIFLGKSLNTQSHRLVIEGVFPLTIALPKTPIQSIQTVTVASNNLSPVTLDTEMFQLIQPRGVLQFKSLPIGDRLEITYAAGYGDTASDVPSLIRQGILHHVAQMYEQREQTGVLPELSRTLYHPYREIRL